MDLTAVLLTPIAGGIVGYFVWFFQSRVEAARRARDLLHDERRKLYVEVLEPFIRAFTGSKTPSESAKAIKTVTSYQYRKTAFELNLIGSDAVVRSFNDMMQFLYAKGTESPTASQDLLKKWGGLLLEIRKNLGQPKTALEPVDMLRSQITDIDDFLK